LHIDDLKNGVLSLIVKDKSVAKKNPQYIKSKGEPPKSMVRDIINLA
jgi:hypothetical protein